MIIFEQDFEEMLRQLERAEHFIFLEYFIVDEGVMWGRVLEILARKAAEGVEVRIGKGFISRSGEECQFTVDGV